MKWASLASSAKVSKYVTHTTELVQEIYWEGKRERVEELKIASEWKLERGKQTRRRTARREEEIRKKIRDKERSKMQEMKQRE